MRSNARPLILLITVLAGFGGYAWLTRHPDTGILRRAESWPFIGPLASGFRERYTVPPVPDLPTGEGAATEIVKVIEPVVPPIGDGFVWVIPGTVLRREPSETSSKILQFDAIANVVKLENRGDWYRIWNRGREGWVYLEGYEDEEPPYGSDPEPPRPLPSKAPDAEALAAARAQLGGRERVLMAGPYKLYTDSDDDDLLDDLGRVASRFEDTYVERYGRRPVDEEAKEAVVLYDEEAAYRRLQNRSARLLGLLAGGHTTSGLAVLYVGRRPRWEVASTLVHELAHTLNRRSLGPALPSWLDEGLADDLASSQIDDDGRIVLGSLGGQRRQDGVRISMRGGVASLWELRDRVRAGDLLHVRELLDLEWKVFVRADQAERNYAAAAFWVRFLLDADEGHAEAFRGYLRSISEGGPSTPEALRERLGVAWDVLNARYQLWIDFQKTPSGWWPILPRRY